MSQLPTLLLLLAAAGQAGAAPTWQMQASGTTASLRGLSVVDDAVVWASGTGGTILRTTDGGRTWTSVAIPGAGDLDFRDVEAFDARTAVVLAAGPGDKSRVYRTEDGGAHWSLAFTNPDADGFLDALAFWDRNHGLLVGDPVKGKFRLFRTDDGGRRWEPIAPTVLPAAREGEGLFAASGTCLVALPGTRDAWFATGGTGGGRVFHTVNGGTAWSLHSGAFPSTKATEGTFSLAFADASHGWLAGGDYAWPDQPGWFVARTTDGGRTWQRLTEGPRGFRSCVALAPGKRPTSRSLLVVGSTGGDLGRDGGSKWTPLGPTGFHAVAVGKTSAWAVGSEGRVARLDLPATP